MTNKNSLYASLLAQEAKRNEANRLLEESNVEHLNTFAIRIDRSCDPATQDPRLRVIVPGKSQPEIYDFSFLLAQPLWAELISEGFRVWAEGVSVRTRRSALRDLAVGFGVFLAKIFRGATLSVEDIDEAFWTAFLRFLDEPKNGGKPWAVATRGQRLSPILAALKALRSSDHTVADTAGYILDRTGFPCNPWPGRTRLHKPTVTLSQRDLDRVVECALAEVARIKIRLDHDNMILEAGRQRLAEARWEQGLPDCEMPIFKEREFIGDLGLACAWIYEKWPNSLAQGEDIRAIQPALVRALNGRGRGSSDRRSTKGLGINQVRRVLYSTARDLVPFVVLLGHKTAFNPDTLLSLDWSGVQEVEVGLERRIRISGMKDRASTTQSELHHADIDADGVPVGLGLSDLLQTLRRVTQRTRRLIAPDDWDDHGDRLFVAVPHNASTHVRGFESSSGPSGDMRCKYALTGFIADNGLQPFTLKQLRPSVGEETYRATGGDLKAVQNRLQHKRAQTTLTHYNSAAMRRDSQERMAGAQVLLTRWIETEGQADSRRRRSWDQAAATPGWLCLDPFDSPIPGQSKGRICSAYGLCAICPLAATKADDVYAVAAHQSVLRAINEAIGKSISNESWISRWSPIRRVYLEKVIPSFDVNIRQQAEQIRINTPIVT